MQIYFSREGWRLLDEEGKYFFCYINSGHGGAEFKIEIDKTFVDYLLKENPKFDVIMEMIHKKGFVKI